jgi:hypothetical protein
MITEQELDQAKIIVRHALEQTNNDRSKALDYIYELCDNNPETLKLFAKVGQEVFDSSQAVKH